MLNEYAMAKVPEGNVLEKSELSYDSIRIMMRNNSEINQWYPSHPNTNVMMYY
jgi:hypothetical protein